jgi:hypothetical protein
MALSSRIALLRAVNVGGRKLLMAELRQLALDVGLEAPRTLIQSGNLVFASALGDAALEGLLERETWRASASPPTSSSAALTNGARSSPPIRTTRWPRTIPAT